MTELIETTITDASARHVLAELAADETEAIPALDGLSKDALKLACTLSHARFVEEFANGGKRKDAAVKVGFSAKCASHQACVIMARPEAKAYYNYLLAEKAKRNEINPDWVIHKLRAEIEDKSPKSSQAARVQAIRLMSDILGMTKNEIANVIVPVKVFVGINVKDV